VAGLPRPGSLGEAGVLQAAEADLRRRTSAGSGVDPPDPEASSGGPGGAGQAMSGPINPRCPECGAKMRLDPRARRWLCHRAGCRGSHGARPDGTPMGTPGDAEPRQARILAHQAFDTLREDAVLLYPDAVGDPESVKRIRRIARRRAYWWLARRLGMGEDEAHIANMDRAKCMEVVRVCADTTPSDIRAWGKREEQRRRDA